MRLGILSDTHDDLLRTRVAVQKLKNAGAEALVHCGDLASPPIVEACAVLPCWFVFGNHDADSAASLQAAAQEFGASCLEWGGNIDLAGKRIGVVHGHLTTDVTRVLAAEPNYLLVGHTHCASDAMVGQVRRINSGSLHRAEELSVAILDLLSGELKFVPVPKYPGLL